MRNILISLFLIMCTNCTLISASSIDDFKKGKQFNDAVKIQANDLDAKYVGSSKGSIIDELGKPYEIIHKQFTYAEDKNCHEKGCPMGKSDEVWIYQFRDTSKNGIHSYEIWVYIKEGKIVRIR